MAADQNEKRDHLFRVTLHLILENGLQATSMSRISREAGIPVGSIYRLFSGKEALVNALYRACRDLLFAPLAAPQEELEPEEAFRRMFRRYVHTALEHREAFLFVEQYHLSPVIAEKGRIEEDFRLGAKRLTELGREGRLQPLDPLILDAIVLGTLNHLLCLHFAGYLMLDQGVLEAALSACWRAIARDA